eukprot:g5595.t1
MLDLGSFDKDERDDMQRTPLHVAAMAGRMSMAKSLLCAGADVTLLPSVATCALLAMGVREGGVEVAKMAIEHGADVNVRNAQGTTILQLAVTAGKAEMVSMLCGEGAALNAFDDLGRTALHLATTEGLVAVMEALMAAGALVDLGDERNGQSALVIATEQGNADAVEAIIKHGADVNAADQIGGTALHTAAVYNRPRIIDMLIDAGASTEPEGALHGHAPLHCATRYNNLDCVITLVKRGANINKQASLLATPLHFAAGIAGEHGVAEVVEYLLRHGADETITTIDGETVADIVGYFVEEENSLPGEVDRVREVERVRELLENAPTDRAWRRRGFLVMCRAHYPSGRVRLGWENDNICDSVANITLNHAGPTRAEVEWAGVASMLMGAGADRISLMGNGADVIFETIVGYL